MKLSMNLLRTSLMLAVKQDVDRRIEVETFKMLDKRFEEELEVRVVY